jgi:hypothetical protein
VSLVLGGGERLAPGMSAMARSKATAIHQRGDDNPLALLGGGHLK